MRFKRMEECMILFGFISLGGIINYEVDVFCLLISLRKSIWPIGNQ